MTHGIVVQHKETKVRYAVSEANYNEKVHTKVRDLKPSESVLGYRPHLPEDDKVDIEDLEATEGVSQATEESTGEGNTYQEPSQVAGGDASYDPEDLG